MSGDSGLAPSYRGQPFLVLNEQGQCLAQLWVQRGAVRAMTDMIFIMTDIVDMR